MPEHTNAPEEPRGAHAANSLASEPSIAAERLHEYREDGHRGVHAACPICLQLEAERDALLEALEGVYHVLTSPQAPSNAEIRNIIEDIVDEALHGESVHGAAIRKVQDDPLT